MAAYRCRKCGECFASKEPEPVHECGGIGYPRNPVATEVFIWRD